MSLDALVQEIRTRSEAELVRIGRDRAAEEARIATERDGRIAALREEQSRQAQAEAGRVRAQVLAAATVNARKKVYEAREHKLRAAVDATAELLRGYAGTDDYTETLRRMVAEATDRLGKQLRITGRADDAARLSKVAGKAFDPSPQPILGGLIAETPDGSRRLDLSFDELLRLREPKVRELLA